MKTNHVSLLTALQKEGLADGQLRHREVLVGRKPKAKRWPDEQEPQRRGHRTRGPVFPKSKVCTEGAHVVAAGISVKVGASYLGRSGCMPERASRRGNTMEKCTQKSAEVVVARDQGRRTEPR
jgi:hypothetical protein